MSDLVSVAGLHALAYCERLFFLEEVEQIRIADAAVFAGRALHAENEARDVEGELRELSLESDRLGIMGRLDVLRRKSGAVVPYERKRGRCCKEARGKTAWRTDRIQVGAYALLVEEALGQSVDEALVRYHADNVTVTVPIDDSLRTEVVQAIARARALRVQVERPPVTENERLCARCSLAPACLPEEGRRAADEEFRPIRLFPPHQERMTVHVAEPGARVGRSGDQLVVEGTDKRRLPIAEVGAVVLHGYAQISTQAIRMCTEKDVMVHWVSMGGTLVGSLAPSAQPAQRHLRQFKALSDDDVCLGLAKKLVTAKVESQLRFLLRATRDEGRSAVVVDAIEQIRMSIRRVADAGGADVLRGLEGNAASAYFSAMPGLLGGELDARLRFVGRSRRPPKDRVNALLGYGYGMLYREVLGAILAVGLHPGVGFFHRPRSAAHTLALDLMELFRVSIVDMAFVAALNRRTFEADGDFSDTAVGVFLSASGRKKAIEVFERRKGDVWKHSAVGYSLSYARMIELEVRLLEKEWCGEAGLFATQRIR